MLSKLKHYTTKVSQNKLCTKVDTQNLKSKMSTHRVRHADKGATGQAAKNNPPIKKNGRLVQHPEITREECSANDCKDQKCPTPCGPILRETSVGNLSTGTPNTSIGITVTLDNVTSDGQAKIQNAHMYHKAHNTEPNQAEILVGTAFVKKPNVESIIHHYEDKE